MPQDHTNLCMFMTVIEIRGPVSSLLSGTRPPCGCRTVSPTKTEKKGWALVLILVQHARSQVFRVHAERACSVQ